MSRRTFKRTAKVSGPSGCGFFPSVSHTLILFLHVNYIDWSYIVIGWLQVSPKCDHDRVAQALDKANERAFVATSDLTEPEPISHRTNRPAFILQHYRLGSVHRDEESSAPIFNYSRFFAWVHVVEQVADAFENASENAQSNVPVSPHVPWRVAPLGKLDDENRKGTLDDVQRYCSEILSLQVEVREGEEEVDRKSVGSSMAVRHRRNSTANIPMTTLSSRSSYPSYQAHRRDYRTRRREKGVSRWGSDVWTRVVVASVLALFLQWGTAIAAFMIVVRLVYNSSLLYLLTFGNFSGSPQPED